MSSTTPHLIIIYLLFYVYKCFACYMIGASRDQKRALYLLRLELLALWATMWGLATKPEPLQDQPIFLGAEPFTLFF